MAENVHCAAESASENMALLKRENAELRAYLKAFCVATIDPEDLGRDVGAHEANPFITYAFQLVEEGDPQADRAISGGQVRRAMELVGFDKLKIQPSDQTIADELTEARDLRRAVKDFSASVTIPGPGDEERDFWLMAAEQHGFQEAADGSLYTADPDEVLKLMAAAREQGRKDVLDALATEAARDDVKCHCVSVFGPNPECGACGGSGCVSETTVSTSGAAR